MNRVFFFIIIFITLSVNSQQNIYKFRNITTSDGLSQSSVIAIHQDQFGQIWVGTRDGLNLYDGSRFIVFRNNPKDSLSISNNDILSIEEDSSGYIWVGTYNGVNRYNPIDKTFKRYFRENKKSSLTSNVVETITEIDDEIWMGTTNGITIYNKKEESFYQLSSKGGINDLPESKILKILRSSKGDIWVGTSKGLCKLISRKNNQFFFKHYYKRGNNDKLYIKDILENKDASLLVATRSKGLLKISHKKDILRPYKKNILSKNIDKDVRRICFDNEDNLWLGTANGVYILNKDESLKAITNTFSKVKSIYKDNRGSIWIGKYYGGISIWDKTNTNFINYNHDSDQGKLSYNVISSILSDHKENIYFGTEGGGITMLNTKTFKPTYINTSNTKGLLDNNIKSLLLRDDELWIGTFSGGLSIYNLKYKKIDAKRIPPSLLNIIGKRGVYDIKREDENTVWLSVFGNGVVRYDFSTDSILHLTSNPKKINNLSGNSVRTTFIDSKRRIWIGTQSGMNSLVLDNLKEDDFKIKSYFFNEKSGSGSDILTIFEDANQNIWVGTKFKGLFRFNGIGFEKVDISEGNVKVISVHAILEDNNRNLWLSSNQGIVKYNYKRDEVKVYSEADGLISSEFNDNSCLKLNSNLFYFGGPLGVTSFNPENIIINEYAPEVILTDFKIKNQSVKINDQDGILDKSILYTNKIKLPYNKANFSIDFSIPNFINTPNNRYAYRMIGLDDQWVHTSNSQAAYTIQKSGTYTFELSGANNHGIWNTSLTKLEIIVTPAPWRTWWAYTLYIIFIGLAFFILMKFLKSNADLKHELELEHIENVRNDETNKMKLQFFTNISHEFRTPLTLILGPLQQLLEDYRGSNTMYKKLLVIENNANHLLKLINRLMDFRKLENNQLKLQSAEGNIVKFIYEIYLSFIDYAKVGDYDYDFSTTDDKIKVYYDRAKLERVFYNLISNAFRYTPEGGKIDVDISKEGEFIKIEVKDTGVGIEEQYLDKIFDRFFEVSIHNQPQGNYKKGTGIGLSIVKNIIKLHKGHISVVNREHKGTKFSLLLPLGKKHLEDHEILSDFKLSDDLSQYEAQLENIMEHTSSNENLEDLIVKKERANILIVEDNTLLRQFIKNLLKEEYNIFESENGKVAMETALKEVPDLIISDVIMPEMVGTELCATIKENIRTSHIPVILLTSRSSLVYKFEGLESGADAYISKPFNIKEFKLKIKNILDAVDKLRTKFTEESFLKPSDVTVSSIDEKLLEKAFSIVEENLANEYFDIAYFCTELGVSRTMLFTKIKAWTNFTPKEFIKEIRLKRAAQILEQNKISISQVSYKVGFKSPKYFSKYFSKKFGITPSEYQGKFSN